MSNRSRKILDQAMALSAEERAALATQLIQSLDAIPVDRDKLERAWAKEIERRCAAVESGHSTMTDWSMVRDAIEGHLRSR